jgi:hypothetical protein
MRCRIVGRRCRIVGWRCRLVGGRWWVIGLSRRLGRRWRRGFARSLTRKDYRRGRRCRPFRKRRRRSLARRRSACDRGAVRRLERWQLRRDAGRPCGRVRPWKRLPLARHPPLRTSVSCARRVRAVAAVHYRSAGDERRDHKRRQHDSRRDGGADDISVVHGQASLSTKQRGRGRLAPRHPDAMRISRPLERKSTKVGRAVRFVSGR